MNEHNAGGPANTPPFPRVKRSQAEAPGQSAPPPHEDTAATQRGVDSGAPTGAEPEQSTVSDDTSTSRSLGDRTRTALHTSALRGLRRALAHLADQVEETAERLQHVAEDRMHGEGRRGQVGAFVHSAAGWLGHTADYFRESEPEDLRSDLERRVIEKPLQTVLITFVAGWVIGKIIR